MYWRGEGQTEPVAIDFDHEKADWTEVANRVCRKLHPGMEFSTPAWLEEQLRLQSRGTTKAREA